MNKICVIDDDLIQHKITERVLNNYGLSNNCTFYQSAANALLDITLAYFSEEPLPELIILDKEMPEISGWEFVETFCKVFSPDGRVSVYIVSSSIEAADKERSRKYPCVKGLYPKPFSSEIFNSIGSEVVEGS